MTHDPPLKPGQLVWLRHPVFKVPHLLCRVVGIASVDQYDVEYDSVDVLGEYKCCYGSYLEPLSAVEVLALELYGKTPRDLPGNAG